MISPVCRPVPPSLLLQSEFSSVSLTCLSLYLLFIPSIQENGHGWLIKQTGEEQETDGEAAEIAKQIHNLMKTAKIIAAFLPCFNSCINLYNNNASTDMTDNFDYATALISARF